MMRLLLAMLVAIPAMATEPPPRAGSTASEVECRYDGSQREMNACAIRDYKAADAALNRAYCVKMKGLRPGEKKALRAEQRAWIQRRDARCLSRKTGEGTNVTIDYLTCLQSYTEVRALQLR